MVSCAVTLTWSTVSLAESFIWFIEPLIEPGAGVVLPVLPVVPLPGVEALLFAVGAGAVAALLPIEPLLPVDPPLFFVSLPEEALPVEPLPMLPPVEPLPEDEFPILLFPVVPLPVVLVPVVLAPMLPAPLAALPMLPPVELLPVELEVGPVLLPGMFLLVSTMMISFKKSTIKHPQRMRIKGEPAKPAADLFWTSR